MRGVVVRWEISWIELGSGINISVIRHVKTICPSTDRNNDHVNQN